MPQISSKKPDKATLSGLIKLHSLREIATKYGVSAKTVCKWCQKDNIKVVRKHRRQDSCQRRLNRIKTELFDKSNMQDSFYTANGTVISNLYDLSVFLNNADHSVFALHVNEHKNDFSKWIFDVLKKEDLALSLHNSMTREKYAHVVDRFIIERLKDIVFSKI
jgi:hypothetical protein